MECSEFQDIYLKQSETGGQVPDEAITHKKDCTQCNVFVRDLENLDTLLKEGPGGLELYNDFVEDVMAQVSDGGTENKMQNSKPLRF